MIIGDGLPRGSLWFSIHKYMMISSLNKDFYQHGRHYGQDNIHAPNNANYISLNGNNFSSRYSIISAPEV